MMYYSIAVVPGGGIASAIEVLDTGFRAKGIARGDSAPGAAVLKASVQEVHSALFVFVVY
jgi:hypothetical protein